jgi:hypothetical protein
MDTIQSSFARDDCRQAVYVALKSLKPGPARCAERERLGILPHLLANSLFVLNYYAAAYDSAE